MANCNRNHKRDYAILISILLHVLLFLFLFYKIKEQFDESESIKTQSDNPIFLSQDLASNIEPQPEKSESEKITEPEVDTQAIDLSSQLMPNEQKEESQVPDTKQEDIQEQNEPEAIEESIEQSITEVTTLDKNNIIQEKIIKEVKKKFTRKSILANANNVPKAPNIIDYIKEDLKTNLFKLISNNANSDVDIKYLSYHQKVLNFFERAFSALYVGKSLGIPKHEFEQLEMGIVVNVIVDINKNGTIKSIMIKSKSPEFDKCIQRAFEHAAPFPNIPDHFKMNVFRLKAQLPMGMSRSGKGLMQVYPT